MALTWDDIGNAIVAAVARAGNLPDGHVIWKHQNYNAPAHRYVTLSLPSVLEIGQDFIRRKTDLSRPRGQEVELAVRGTREAALELELFTDANVAGDSNAALAQMISLTASLKLPSVHAILSSYAISAFDVGRINWIPDIPGAVFRGRAVCTVRCYMPLPTVAEYAGFIERVIGKFTAYGSISDPIETAFDTSADND